MVEKFEIGIRTLYIVSQGFELRLLVSLIWEQGDRWFDSTLSREDPRRQTWIFYSLIQEVSLEAAIL